MDDAAVSKALPGAAGSVGPHATQDPDTAGLLIDARGAAQLKACRAEAGPG